MTIQDDKKKYFTFQELEVEEQKYHTGKKVYLFDLDHTLYCIRNEICKKLEDLFYDIIRKNEGDVDVYKFGNILKEKWNVCLFRSILCEYEMKEEDLKKIISNLDFKNLLRENEELNFLLKKLDGVKFVFTNIFVDYAKECMKYLNLENEFEKIICADFFGNFKYQKPYEEVFKIFENYFPDTKREDFVFFDDLEENIMMAKKRGWTVCLISYEKNTPSYLKKFIK